ncbi:hypothetical protein C8F04DRAFT_1272815 [Mycena alexandri]|uniref:Uncharacterized protein n=1 Tax=Mycena alexandri TaxID=1745969 RepID=A0AAD6WRB1_9AGAR|nr:hypothetical protein C8F04DRAFT_1272815 [Mycena alexandri]
MLYRPHCGQGSGPHHTHIPLLTLPYIPRITAIAFSRCVQIAAATIKAGLQYKIILTMMAPFPLSSASASPLAIQTGPGGGGYAPVPAQGTSYLAHPSVFGYASVPGAASTFAPHASTSSIGLIFTAYQRRDDYAICDSNGQTHFWLFYVPTCQRYRIERLMHLDFLSRARRNIRKCSGCRKHHREYWRFIFVGPFQRIRARVFALLARIGEPGARLIPLNDYHRVF